MATIRKDIRIMELLGLNEISHMVAKTSKGDLTLQLRKGEATYHLVLDAIPVDREIHEELMQLLYGADIPQVNNYIEMNGTKGIVLKVNKKTAKRLTAKSKK